MIVFSVLLLHGVVLFIGSSPTRVAVHSNQIRKNNKKKKKKKDRKRLFSTDKDKKNKKKERLQ